MLVTWIVRRVVGRGRLGNVPGEERGALLSICVQFFRMPTVCFSRFLECVVTHRAGHPPFHHSYVHLASLSLSIYIYIYLPVFPTTADVYYCFLFGLGTAVYTCT